MCVHSSAKFLFLIFLIAGNLHESVQNRCLEDEECKDVETCDEIKYFISRNEVEIRKLKVCGTQYGTKEFCCKTMTTGSRDLPSPPKGIKTSEALTTHKNIDLINHAKCGKANVDRITGGATAKIGSLPWMALLAYTNTFGEKIFGAGGSLISPKYVLTAAHCVRVPQKTLVAVRLGEHTISTKRDCIDPKEPATCNNDDPPFQDIEIVKQIVHPDYLSQATSDIALLRLKTAAILGSHIVGVATICLPVKESQTIETLFKEDPSINQLNVAGWGYTEDTPDSNSDVLKQANLPFITNDQCLEKFGKVRSQTRNFTIDFDDSILCAGGFNKTDACRGDSGGPITSPAPNDNDNYRYFQQGIVARGLECSNSIVSPGIFTRVFHYMKWILDNLEH